MTYLFQCQNCQTIFEISASFSTVITLHPNCPECKSNNTKRKYLAPQIVYKGKGFYKTDNG